MLQILENGIAVAVIFHSNNGKHEEIFQGAYTCYQRDECIHDFAHVLLASRFSKSTFYLFIAPLISSPKTL